MAQHLAIGGPTTNLSRGGGWKEHLDTLICAWPGTIRRLLLIPPDKTRLKSFAGEICRYLWERLTDRLHIDVLPALGTHAAMGADECQAMFGSQIPQERILYHDYLRDVEVLGEIPASTLERLSADRLRQSVKIGVNKHVFAQYDIVLSLGQVVPHEVVGMANYTKNVVIGTGGPDLIHKSHFLGALYGIEKIMGEIDTPVRWLLDHAFDTFVRPRANVLFLLTVLQSLEGESILRGLYCGDGYETYRAACELSRQVNVIKVAHPLQKCVVYLDPREFSTTWVGNKAIYRTRRAMADGGELIVLAPKVRGFGEKPDIDRLIRRHGYRGTPATMEALASDPDLAKSLSSAAHLIHGSTEGRFSVTYAVGPELCREDIEGVGFRYAVYADVAKTYLPAKPVDGFYQAENGEECYFVRDPGQGLWVA